MTSIFSIAVSGLNNAATRVANAAANIVNSSSTSKLPSSPADPYTGFTPQDVISISLEGGKTGLGVSETLQPRTTAYVAVPDPTSPFANDKGLVATPNVDLNSDLVASMEAKISYSANAKLIKIGEEMQKSLLDAIG